MLLAGIVIFSFVLGFTPWASTSTDVEGTKARICELATFILQETCDLVECGVNDFTGQLACELKICVLTNGIDEILLLHFNTPLRSVA